LVFYFIKYLNLKQIQYLDKNNNDIIKK
jgi:hypothetical protein